MSKTIDFDIVSDRVLCTQDIITNGVIPIRSRSHQDGLVSDFVIPLHVVVNLDQKSYASLNGVVAIKGDIAEPQNINRLEMIGQSWVHGDLSKISTRMLVHMNGEVIPVGRLTPRIDDDIVSMDGVVAVAGEMELTSSRFRTLAETDPLDIYDMDSMIIEDIERIVYT